jgi:hypothetical protein
MQELQQRLGIELLERLVFDAGNNRCNEPTRLAHLDHGDDPAVLFEGGRDPLGSKGSDRWGPPSLIY